MFRIRPAAVEDIETLLRMERQLPGAGHWSESAYRQIFQPDAPPRLALLAEWMAEASPGQAMGPASLAGLLIAGCAGPQWEIENLAVDPQVRRRGLARALLAELMARARTAGATGIDLEVRESNYAARALYAASGFRQCGLRPGYYRDPEEGAVLYQILLSPGRPG